MARREENVMMLRTLRMTILAGVSAAPLLLGIALAQTEAAGDKQDRVVVTGTRVENRSVLDTAVAVDVLPIEDLEKGGVSEVNQALAVALPSFNFPRPALNDGTDTVRPAALRGLAPDQTLVLVNSKRRHAASLVNVNGSIGRGSSAVDMNTIPTNAISAIEVLRDGASAQYGSDAIAGVINVRLREAREGGGASVSYGFRKSEYTVPVTPPVAGLPITVGSQISREVEDGNVFTLAGWKGLPLGEDGFLTISGEAKLQERSERDGYDTRQNYPTPTGGGFDQREGSFNRFNAWTGEPELQQYTAFANAGYDLGGGVELYGWGSYQFRDSLSAGFYRRASDARNVIEIYPDGFLPKINPIVTDGSAAAGARFGLGDWDMDTSVVYGSNEMQFTIRDTLNRSLGAASKTSFDAGGFQYQQAVFNFSGVKQYEVGLASPLNVAAGIEARQEFYTITAGEPDSYRNGGVLLGGAPTASGAQVFPGFRPANEVDEDRTAVGVYVDLEANITDALLVSGAVRGESYSDFGETVTGKVSARYDFNDMFALRGSAQNGFRAPSLQQQYFATTSTNFIGGVPFDITTFPVTDPVAIALGAKPLEAEESINYSLGGVFRAGDFSLTVDAYRIDVNNRIVLSENLVAQNVRDYLTAQGFIGAGGGRFFINGVDTETQGVDIVAQYALPETSFGQFDVTAGVNFAETDVTAIPAIPVLSALTPAPALFGRANTLTFEQGTPADKETLSVDWTLGMFGATARVVRYGEVIQPDNSPANDHTLSPKTLMDIEGRWYATDFLTVSVGADNLFDEYPDAFRFGLNSTGNTPFSNYSPFGYSGRFVYAKAALTF
jgi:iron complex outermembrane receptor protein